jgi:hypothetical protein
LLLFYKLLFFGQFSLLLLKLLLLLEEPFSQRQHSVRHFFYCNGYLYWLARRVWLF